MYRARHNGITADYNRESSDVGCGKRAAACLARGMSRFPRHFTTRGEEQRRGDLRATWRHVDVGQFVFFVKSVFYHIRYRLRRKISIHFLTFVRLCLLSLSLCCN